MRANKLILALAILTITSFFLVCYSAKAAVISPDAIAIRVMPNSDHYSPLVWYKKNIKLQGSPQNLLVDGYEAVRDGRTVYVNAANISGNNFYTNIYIISYNQDAEASTIDIFGQILAHWKFNTNISDSAQKQKIIRDTKRLADLAEIKIALNNYQKNHDGNYPSLAAGSYLVGKSVSTWPSWQATLGKELGITMPVDPSNKLGACPGYDPVTCWDQEAKRFAGNIPDNLPSGSQVYIYSFDGSTFNICGLMESGFISGAEGACAGSAQLIGHTATATNRPPTIACGALTGCPHDEFVGYVKASDPDGDKLEWSLDTASLGTDWSSWAEGAPVYRNSPGGAIAFKQLWAKKVGNKGQYDLIIKVKDKAADWTTKNCSIVINDRSCDCKDLPTNDVTLSAGAGDGVVYDNNSNSNSANNVAGGSYIKLGTVMPTAYLWVANSNENKVSKIRIFDGQKRDRNGWVSGTWETRGQLIGVYDVGANPSRTAVNVETGDVWVANRDSANVTKLDINGNVKKTCSTGAGPRGLAIQENGDVWVANYGDSNVVKLSGDDTSCAILTTVNTGGNPYGLAIDSNDNVWVANRGSNQIQKINTNSYEVTNYGAGGGNCGDAGYAPYGITVDLNDNVWVADTCHGVYKLTQSTGVVTHHTFAGLANGSGRSRGVTVNMDGSIWIAFDYSNQVVKIPNPANPAAFSIFNTSSSFPIGIVGDSLGGVWSVGYSSGKVDLFNSLGSVLGSYDVSNLAGVQPYTYSDMTGLNRSMILRTGHWTSEIFDSGHNNQHWGKIKWTEIVPGEKQEVEIYVKASDGNINSESWKTAADWNSLQLTGRKGRYLQIKVEMRSRERSKTPVVSALNLDCD